MATYQLRDRDKLLIEKIISGNAKTIIEFMNKNQNGKRFVFLEPSCEHITEKYESILSRYFNYATTSIHTHEGKSRYWRIAPSLLKTSIELHNAFSLLVLLIAIFDAIDSGSAIIRPEVRDTNRPMAEVDTRSAFIRRLIYALIANWNYLVIEEVARILNNNPTTHQKVDVVIDRVRLIPDRLKMVRRGDDYIDIIEKQVGSVVVAMGLMWKGTNNDANVGGAAHNLAFRHHNRQEKRPTRNGLVIDKHR